MSSIPAERDEIALFTPPSLEAMGDDAPVFRLKAPSERCLRRFKQMCEDDGLESFSDADFTAEKRRAIPLYWAEADAQGLIARLDNILEAQKQGITIGSDDIAWVDELDEKLFDAHKPLRVMRRKAGEFQEYAPRIAMAVYIAGWKGIDVPFKLDGGVIDPKAITRLIRALRKLGEMHCPAAPASPFLELYVAASKRLRIDEEEEKNSPAPSQPSMTPDASTDHAPKDGPSIVESSEDANSSSNSALTTSQTGA